MWTWYELERKKRQIYTLIVVQLQHEKVSITASKTILELKLSLMFILNALQDFSLRDAIKDRREQQYLNIESNIIAVDLIIHRLFLRFSYE